jgi:hypothetical protein
MFTIENHVGRLIEVRMVWPVTAQEIEDSGPRMTAILQAIAPRHGVIVGDYAQARVLSVALANRLIEIFRGFTPQIERSGLLVLSDSAGGLLQMERVIRNADNPGRKVFRDVGQLKEWLYDALLPKERIRMDDFFAAARS